jgi:hypothetical protein
MLKLGGYSRQPVLTNTKYRAIVLQDILKNTKSEKQTIQEEGTTS